MIASEMVCASTEEDLFCENCGMASDALAQFLCPSCHHEAMEHKSDTAMSDRDFDDDDEDDESYYDEYGDDFDDEDDDEEDEDEDEDDDGWI